MYRVLIVITFVVGVGLTLSTTPCSASFITPLDPSAVLQVNSDGKPVPLSASDLKLRLNNLNFALDDRKINGDYNPERKKFLKLIKGAEEADKAHKLTPDETAAVAAYYIRIGNLDKADALLAPLSLSRRPSYFPLVTRAHLFALRGDWLDAIENHQVGLECEMPASVKGLSQAQRDWWKKLDDDYVPWLYQVRKRQEEQRKGVTQEQLTSLNNTEEVLPLFPVSTTRSPKAPVRFVNNAGVYQPGDIATAEQAKLPPDAIAVVQQLLLWFPGETRLYWLLAELYAAAGDLGSADLFFEQCAGSRQFANRRIMMEHRAAVRAALPKDAPAEEGLLTNGGQSRSSPPQAPVDDQGPITMRTIWWYFGAIGIVVLYAIVRGKIRRGSCGPGGCG